MSGLFDTEMEACGGWLVENFFGFSSILTCCIRSVCVAATVAYTYNMRNLRNIFDRGSSESERVFRIYISISLAFFFVDVDVDVWKNREEI